MVTISKAKPVTTGKNYVGDPIAFKLMIDVAPDPIIMIKDHKVIYGNKKAIQLIGYSEKELIGANFLNFVSNMEKAKVAATYLSRMAGFKTDSLYEIDIITKKGSVIPAEVNALQIKYFGNTVDFIILRDITKRRIQEKALREEKEQAQKLNELLSGREIKMIELKNELESLKNEIINLRNQLNSSKK